MPDPMRAESITLRDGRTVLIRAARVEDAESVMRNVNRVGKEEVYIMIEEVHDIERERQWLAAFDGVRDVLFVVAVEEQVVGAADCHGGTFTKDRHVGGVGIAVQDGWRDVGLGRALMARVLEWMRDRGFLKAELAVFATNARAKGLYESLGFREEGVRRRHVRIRGAYVDEVLMGLWLGS